MQSLVVKRSVAFGGRRTSVSVEDEFWKALRNIARRQDVTLWELIERIDTNRTQSNLSSAIRLFVLRELQDQIAPPLVRKHTPPLAPEHKGDVLVG
jgi:predicted DNA-binding ribbon-helix-helix protein